MLDRRQWCCALASAVAAPGLLRADDWRQFRGPGGSGVSRKSRIPDEWGDAKNLRWKAALPGPGSSSPVVIGERVFVTCYTGYGASADDPGDPKNLVRHLLCLGRADGRVLWSADVPATRPEDPYRGYLTEHGYASGTPASDGTAVYVFFGKSGVLAYDLDGKRLWQTGVGTESDNRRWGSGSSPVLYKNTVIVNAASESRSVRALDKTTGKQVWKAEAEGLDLSFGTPALVELPSGRAELALAVPGELWGLNPDTGKLFWHADVRMSGNVAPSAVAHNGVVYATGGFDGRGSVAVRAGGKGDVTRSHVVWSARESSYVPSPLVADGRLHWVDDTGMAACLDAATGKVIYRERLPARGDAAGGKAVYASVVLAGDKLIAVTRTAGAFVLAAGPKFRVVAANRLSDDSDFNASPAVADGELFLRSNQAIYCVGA
jgi:outer membrane protein assembly factor BamB